MLVPDAYEKLLSLTGDDLLEAFLTFERLLGHLKQVDLAALHDFEVLGRWVSRSETWDEDTKRRFRMRTIAVYNAAKAQGLVVGSDGYKVR